MNYKAALIGYSGFVGSTLMKQSGNHFTHLYNSTNIEAIEGEGFDLVVCAGAPAQKWIANKEPVKDTATIGRLMRCLSTVDATKFVLISTVDVYGDQVSNGTDWVDENTEINLDGLHAYGLNRFNLETFVRGRYEERAQILRLPGLVGPGLRKNIIYDLKHDNNIGAINGSNVYQFYPMDRLWRDINLTRYVGLTNLSTEPISAAQVAEIFGKTISSGIPTADYDMRSIGAKPIMNKDDYWYSKQEVIEAITEYKNS